MKKLFTYFSRALLVFLFMNHATAQGILGKIKQAAGKDSSLINSAVASGGKKNGALSNADVIAGLKEALSVGTNKATASLSATDGFFKNAALKILMPEEAKKAEATLRGLGMGALVDKAILSMNRAAEDAAGGVSTIFLNAVKGMTVTDGLAILRGGNHAATDYLQKTTTLQLTEKMRPVIEASLAKVNATNYWKDVFTAYNKVSFKKVNTDLSSYVTEKSMGGIFYSIAEQEELIRKDPAAQITPLLKKVFGK